MHLLVSFFLASTVSMFRDVHGEKNLPYGIQVPYPYGAEGAFKPVFYLT